MSVKLELYRVFKEVAEVGNITAAAQALYISQSAVSQSIKQLENDLQTRLFSRNSRGVTLTAEGKMLYEYVRSAMGLLETGEEKLSQTRELQMGQLVIGASDTVTSQFLLPYLDGFHRKHPAIHIQIISGRSHKVLGLLRSGKVDIAFASTPTDMTSLETYPCFPTHSIFVAGAGYPCDFEHVYSLEEISAFPLILLERKASSHRLRRGRRHRGVRHPRSGKRTSAAAQDIVPHPAPLRGHVHAAGRTPDRRGRAFCRLRQAELIQTISTPVFTGKTHKKPQKALKYSSIFSVAFPRKIGQYRTKTFERKCRRCSS